MPLNELRWDRLETVARRVHRLEHYPYKGDFDGIGYTFRLHPNVLTALNDRFQASVFPNLRCLTWPCPWTCQDIPALVGRGVGFINVKGFFAIEEEMESREETLNFSHPDYPMRLAERVVHTMLDLGRQCAGVQVDFDVDVDVDNLDDEILAGIVRAIEQLVDQRFGWVRVGDRCLPGRLVVYDRASGAVARIGRRLL